MNVLTSGIEETLESVDNFHANDEMKGFKTTLLNKMYDFRGNVLNTMVMT